MYYLKKTRESIQLNFHTFLESIDQNIKWYSFKPITDVAIITNDFELTDNLTLQEVLENCEIITDEVYSITIARQASGGLYGSRFHLNVKFDTLPSGELATGNCFYLIELAIIIHYVVLQKMY